MLSWSRFASVEDALAALRDSFLYGEAYLDEQGRRVDPADIVVSPDGVSATDGRRVWDFTKGEPSDSES